MYICKHTYMHVKKHMYPRATTRRFIFVYIYIHECIFTYTSHFPIFGSVCVW